ncbi:MAG TPA: 2OG-Fe(II) oxygenase [Pirellulales bacterium]|nr:2OG-Fe(II) oxygenase [Pirellulales bacterium]
MTIGGSFPLSLDLASNTQEASAYGDALHGEYVSAIPFHHIVIDNFLNPEILDRVISDIQSLPEAAESFARSQERLKSSYDPELLPEYTRNLFRFFNSRPFVVFLEKMTGIPGLITDPLYTGGGIHEIKTGGHLDIHADFNYHAGMKVERRLNALIYLNKDWKPEYGGQFEIWDKNMSQRAKSLDPIFNRCVVFSTDSESYHGNPNVVAHERGLSRFSIALYYYTATWDGTRRKHLTQFKQRPNTNDTFDWTTRTRELLRDITPPFALRLAKRAAKSIKKTSPSA